MPSEEDAQEKTSRRSIRRPKPRRRVSLDFPESLRQGDGEQDDVTAPRSSMSKTMNQSLMNLIAKAGSRPDLQALMEEDSTDTDEDGGLHVRGRTLDGTDGTSNAFGRRLDGARQAPSGFEDERTTDTPSAPRGPEPIEHRNRGPQRHNGTNADTMSTSLILGPRSHQERESDGDTAVLTPRARQGNSKLGSAGHGLARKSKATANLAQRLKEIFNFEEVEEVISEYRCWLLQSVLMQGYMYITEKHICFYAYLPKKHNEAAKTGYLQKRGRSKYNRYWFVLKGDVLAYYTNPADLYFPRNRINLHYVRSATVDSSEKNKDSTAFTVSTDQRTHRFKADSAASAQEWVRAIQKVIFRTNNDGNSVKISLPIRNVLDVEENPMIDDAETVKIRVIDNDETYAIDEYFFSFFSSGEDAFNVLRIMVSDNETMAKHSQGKRCPDECDQSLAIDDAGRTLREHVHATLATLPPTTMQSPGRSHGSYASSVDQCSKADNPRHASRREPKASRSETGNSRLPEASGSLSTLGMDTESSAAIQSLDDSNASASQILSRSDVFQRPTVHRSHTSTSGASDNELRRSQDTARSTTPSKRASNINTGTARPQNLWKSSDSRDEEDDATYRPSVGRSASSLALHGLVTNPLQKASGLAGFLKGRSMRIGNLLTTDAMGYYEKVSGMWAGGRKHYNVAEGLQPNDQVYQEEDDEDAANDADRFREHFALPDTERLMATFFCHLQRVLPIYGKIYVSDHHFCFRSLMPTTRTKLILPLKDIENVNKENGFRLHFSGLCVVIRGHEELFFEFNKSDIRDDCAVTLHRMIESSKYIEDTDSAKQETSDDEPAKAEHEMLQRAREEAHADEIQPATGVISETEQGRPPLIFDDPHASIVDFRPSGSLRITCLTIGSRGDVQPYIALCKGLMAEGHRPRIATHKEFEPWVRKHGIDFAPVDGDPAELMRICVENGMFTVSFMLEATSKFRDWLDGLLATAYDACKGSDVLIESPSAMAGLHIAEALEIPYFRAFTMPWTRTRAYPHAFAVPERKLGGSYNTLSYVAFDAFFWAGIAGQVNRWRRHTLGLPSTTLGKMQPNARPFLYNFSPSVVVPPLDWPDWIRVTGYWFLDESTNWKPPKELVNFIEKARRDNKKLVYVGFGSIVVDDPTKLTTTVVEAVQKADVRCILSKGWSDRLNSKDASKPEVPLPDFIHQIQSAPHDWLFKQVDAVVHHGGAGTTGASLRAGVPTIIKPFFGDQFFFGSRVEDLGVGICVVKINTHTLSRAIWEAVNSQRMIVKARILGEKIRHENGVETAIQTIYRELERAKSFVKKNERKKVADEADFDEDWTMVDQEEELEISQQDLVNWQTMANVGQVAGAGSSSMALSSMALRGVVSAKGTSGSD